MLSARFNAGTRASRMVEERVQRRLAAILAADVVGYSRLMEGDESGTLSRLKAMRREIIDPAIARHAGRIVKLMGDGALVEFASAIDAVICAIEIQKSVAGHDSERPESRRIRFRIGINVGDVIVEGDDIYGDGVNIAARIEALTEPGEVFISRTVADQVGGKIPFRLENRGEHAVKNIERPIEIFAIASDGDDTVASAPRARLAPSNKPAIAVLAFDNMSGDVEQEYFSDGISEDIITDLAKVSGLHVIARNSSFVYKRSAVPIPEVAKVLGVRYVLEGSVRRAGTRVRVTAQLIDASNGGHVWADRYDRELADIFAVQDELTREIVAALKLKLTAEETGRLTRKRDIDSEAYNLFLRAREQVWQHTRAGNISAREILARVIAIEPNYAAAHAHAAVTHVNDYINGWGESPEQSLQTGFEIALRAVAMDPDEPETHFAAGFARLWRHELEEANESVSRCLALAPSLTRTQLLASHVQLFDGRAAAAVEFLNRYMQLDPLHPEIMLQFLAEAQFQLGEFELAIATLTKRLERNPESPTAHALLASCFGHLGQIEKGRAAWTQTLRIDPSFSVERRRRVLPFRNPADFESRVEGLRRLGLSL